ncbi:hypothetical protein G5B30_05185 [Sphingobacterium sp. SGG-5]|uniref:hypothetical protein n=1 Tax=Sphingobacterium sp. SGG-5 TaxID=2710881 RepID=UPI0013EAB499|nr:hypothetical protein [Sphingobacterium sp. SGG-5]NGM61309.1 hypothetical protein [Sphingobacterium sp. SGG-5]
MIIKAFSVLCLIQVLFAAHSSGFACSPPYSPIIESTALANQNGVVEYKGKWYQAGDTIYGYKNYVKLVVGDAKVPLLLGIPHDGVGKGTPEIPVTGTTGRDINTKPLALAIAKLFKKDTGLQPWIVLNEISRKRVEPNTYIEDVDARYGTDSEARKTYDSYHELMLLARTTMAAHLANTQGGLFIDVHGHAHRYAYEQEEEYTSIVTGKKISSRYVDQSDLGYGLAAAALREPDATLDTYADQSTIAGLAQAHAAVPFSALLRGPYSLGALLQAEGVVSVPGNVLPAPELDSWKFGVNTAGNPKSRPYFNGGFLTRRYGTAKEGKTIGFADNISAVQIETPGITVRNNPTIIARSSHKFKRAIIQYLNHWYGCNFPNSDYPYAY